MLVKQWTRYQQRSLHPSCRLAASSSSIDCRIEQQHSGATSTINARLALLYGVCQR
jgi:hypothetical protein